MRHVDLAIEILSSSLSSTEMADLYRAVDVFVLPSRGEGWGRPYLEALAADGRAVQLRLPAGWGERHPRTLHLLAAEAEAWARVGALQLQMPRA